MDGIPQQTYRSGENVAEMFAGLYSHGLPSQCLRWANKWRDHSYRYSSLESALKSIFSPINSIRLPTVFVKWQVLKYFAAKMRFNANQWAQSDHLSILRGFLGEKYRSWLGRSWQIWIWSIKLLLSKWWRMRTKVGSIQSFAERALFSIYRVLEAISMRYEPVEWLAVASW